jgi:PPK2 family polyphosphate:nucleotide phosphotransferase
MTRPKAPNVRRIENGADFRLSDCDPADDLGLDADKHEIKEMLADGVEKLAALQERLYAEGRWAVLVVLQGMDAAGKDGTVKHVMSSVSPQGCEVHSFKVPSEEELQHDFLWRTSMRLPPRGKIGIFNRSYYEEVLVVRVHPDLLVSQKLPSGVSGATLWKQRFEDICAFERHLVQNGTLVLKFHLQMSKEEQRRRLLSRLDVPVKRWKFSMADVHEREHWDDYMAAYEDMIRATAIPEAPWYIIPADHKHVARLAVAAAITAALERLDPQVPKISGERLKELKAAEAELRAQAPAKAKLKPKSKK